MTNIISLGIILRRVLDLPIFSRILILRHYNGQAFRAPTAINLETHPNLHPKLTKTAELEFGYNINKNMLLTANMFNINSKDTIIYGLSPFATSTRDRTYYNAAKSGTRGIETEACWKDKWGYVTTNYSFYRVTQDALNDFKALNYQAGKITVPYI